MENLYKKLPQMNEILNKFGENSQILKDIANDVLDDYRNKIKIGENFETSDIFDEIKLRYENHSPY